MPVAGGDGRSTGNGATKTAKIAKSANARLCANNRSNLDEEHARSKRVLTAGGFISGQWCADRMPNINRWAPTRLSATKRFHEAHDLVVQAWSDLGRRL